jgi:hypothetical protein
MTIDTLATVSSSQLRKAAALKDRIAKLEKQLGQVLKVAAAPAAASAAKAAAPKQRARRKMSAAARKRMSELTRARWKKIKAAGKTHL